MRRGPLPLSRDAATARAIPTRGAINGPRTIAPATVPSAPAAARPSLLRRGALRFLLAILRDEDSDDAALISDDAALILGSAAEADNVDDDINS